MSVAVQEDTARARSLGRRLLAIVDRAGKPARTRGNGWVYLAIAGLAVIAGAVSLRLPTTPNYDPWVWVIWGREIVHGHLSTTGGPTLKPLALVFTTIVAPFGSAAPNMWVAIARAGALTAVALTFLLTTRLSRIATAPLGAVGWALALAAGLVAAGGVLLLQSYVYVVAQGYSEGLLLTVLLLGVLRHLDGAPRQTQALLFAASLDRPEMWPLFIVYGLWLWRVDRGARRQIACLVALILPIWLLPDLIGSGSLLRGAEYASYPRGAGTTACPFCSEITRYEWPLVRLPFRIGVVLAFVPAVATLAFARGATRARQRPQRRLDVCLGVLLVAAIALFLEDAVLTELKFSGNGRYLFPAACLTIVVGMVGWARFAAWALAALSRFGRRAIGWGAVAVVTAGAVAAIVPSAVDAFAKLGPTWSQLRFQADVRRDLTTAVARAGGAARLRACGAVETNTQLVPLVAWTLHETIQTAEATRGRVIIQGRATSTSGRFPWIPWIPRSLGWHVVAKAGTVEIATRC
jgi:hypothetical protein